MNTRSPLVRRSFGFAAVAMALVGLAACGGDDGSSSATTQAPTTTAAPDGNAVVGTPDLDGRSFISTSVDGQELVVGTQVSLHFKDGVVAMSAGCNTAVGAYGIEGDVLHVGTLAQTRMACQDDATAQDAWLVALLVGSPTVTFDDASLTLASAEVTLELADVTSGATNALDGTDWSFDSVTVDGATTKAPEGTSLHIAATTVSVGMGCNTAFGEVTLSDTTLSFGELGQTLMACDGPGGDFEALLAPVLTGDYTVARTGDTLTLTSDTVEMALTLIP